MKKALFIVMIACFLIPGAWAQRRRGPLRDAKGRAMHVFQKPWDWTDVAFAEYMDGSRNRWHIPTLESSVGGTRPILIFFTVVDRKDGSSGSSKLAPCARMHTAFVQRHFTDPGYNLSREFVLLRVDLGEQNVPRTTLEKWGVRHSASYSGPNPRLILMDCTGNIIFTTSSHSHDRGFLLKKMKIALDRSRKPLS